MKKAKDVTNPYEHLKIVEIQECSDLICDVKLLKYILHYAVALKKIVIDPYRYGATNLLGDKQAARCRLASLLPQGVDLCIL